MSTVEAPREQELVVGTVQSVVQKGEGKFQAVVLPDGSQYNKNLWTKDNGAVSWFASMIGRRVSILCNASHWTRQDGQPVRSLWIEQYGFPTDGAQAAAPQQQPQAAPPPQQATMVHPPQAVGQPVVVQPTVEPMVAQAQAPVVTPQQKEQRIMREAASKVAAILLSNLPQDERNLSTLIVLSERLVKYYEDGMPQTAETLDDLMQRAMPASMEYTNEPPPPGDDDIPF